MSKIKQKAVDEIVERAIKDEVERVFNEKIGVFIESIDFELKKRIPKMVVGVSTGIMKQINYETSGNGITIKIQTTDSW